MYAVYAEYSSEIPGTRKEFKIRDKSFYDYIRVLLNKYKTVVARNLDD